MLKIRKYYLLIFGLFLLSGCVDKKDETGKVFDKQALPREQIIKRLEHRNSKIEQADLVTYIYYRNTTVKKQSIGEFIDDDIESLTSKEKGLNTKDVHMPFVEYDINQIPEQRKTTWLVRATLDNDIFSNTDYYYTNGFKLELIIPGLNKSPINKIFAATRHIDIDMCGFSITQNIYTPTNPDTKDVLLGDHPFASYLAIGQFREVYNLSKSIYFKSELKIGVIGPASLGQQVQSSIHEIEPVGWQNQINNDFLIDYKFQFKKGLINSSLFDFNLIANGNIGTLFNKVGGGFDLRFGHFTPFYSGPLSIFEFENPGGHLQYWLFLKANGNIVAYDATLQGGMFNKESPYTIMANELNHFVVNASIGFAIYYNNIGIEYEHYYLSPEFKGARNFGWGSIKATIAF